MNDKRVIVFDIEQMRPACVILQALLGGDGEALKEFFGTEGWLVNPTPDMKRYEATPEQWRRIAARAAR